MNVEFVEELKRQWLAMIDGINDPLVIIDDNFNILRQNIAYVNLSQNAGQLTIKEFQGKKCYQVFANKEFPCNDCQIKELLNSPNSKSISEFKANWVTTELIPEKDIEIQAKLLPKIVNNQNPNQFVIHYRDITELRRLQEGLAQADKLSALGKLAGGVAHEINSPLAGILAFSQILLKEIQPSDPHHTDLLEIEDAARKCKTIVEGLLNFARQERSSDFAKINVSDVISSTIRLALPLLKKNQIDVQLHVPERKHFIFGNPGKLGQVFLNLITNAAYSMKESGGSIEIFIESEEKNVVVSVQDSGIGIEHQNLKKIFDPFFTTKPIGDGTGLGLSISYSIIKQCGGEIRVSSELGVGSVFTVVIPICE